MGLGSPPPMRGKVGISGLLECEIGITPAYAGKSSKLLSFSLPDQDHPRLCGEKLTRCIDDTEANGSPPPMRGKAAATPSSSPLIRITPAYAGKRTIFGKHLFHSIGSPPPMRGKAKAGGGHSETIGITPAYAGKSFQKVK